MVRSNPFFVCERNVKNLMRHLDYDLALARVLSHSKAKLVEYSKYVCP